ncbi:MAG: hypothetical protein WB952_09000 [Terriglobales bacterium]
MVDHRPSVQSIWNAGTHFRDLLIAFTPYHTPPEVMDFPPSSHAQQRPPRIHLADLTPAVLRFLDGRRTAGKLQVVSVSGGLLSLSKPLPRGALVRLLFLTAAGPVLGTAEMLSPVFLGAQPFRFVALYDDDQNRLSAAIQSSLDSNRRDQQNIEKYRTW